MSERSTGMLLGKFLPPHNGHRYLIDFARHYVDDLDVLCCTLPTEPIDGELRYRWMQAMFPDVAIHHVTDIVPQEPAEHPDFWDIWRELVVRHVRTPPQYVFASENYGARLAAELGSEFVPVDIARELVPVSGTAIREDPDAYWDDIPEVVRPHFRPDYEPQPAPEPPRRVCIFGPESTGKSTLAKNLADHFGTNYVHEYARPLLDPKGGDVDYADMSRIARGQSAAEEAIVLQTLHVLFCDTDPLTTTIWSDVMFGRVPAVVQALAKRHTYDLYLLCDVDVPWVDDDQRYFPDDSARRAFFDRCKRALESRGRDYVVVRGSWADRLETAVCAVDRIGRDGG